MYNNKCQIASSEFQMRTSTACEFIDLNAQKAVIHDFQMRAPPACESIDLIVQKAASS